MSAATGTAAKTERLLNLVLVLLYTRRPLSKAQIRSLVPQYGATASTEAFDRMFERDKDELRELGVPLRTEAIDAFFEDEMGYRIDQREYRLPEIDFTADELAVVGLASRAWSQASLAGPAAQALRKLQAAGLERDEEGVSGIEPLLHTTEPAFEQVRRAVLTRTPIRFSYRGGGADAVTERHVQPWALTSWHGRWYLTGHDLDREAPRVFRLDRVEGTVALARRAGTYAVPADHDARTMITASQGQGGAEERVRARIALQPGSGHLLRRRAAATSADADGWDVVLLEEVSRAGLVADVAGLGPAARVLEPADLADAVQACLRSVVATHTDPPASGQEHA